MIVEKITEGCVVQIYDTDKREWLSQRFVASDVVGYVSKDDDLPLTEDPIEDDYLPFEMVQPQDMEEDEEE